MNKLLTLLLSLFCFSAIGQTTRDSLVYTTVTTAVTHDTTFTVQITQGITHDSTYTRVDTIKILIPDTLFRGIYVNGTSSIVGNKVKEDALIADLKKYKINHTSHYSISTTGNPTGMANLFTRIKKETGVTTISPAISSTGGINNWANWNATHSGTTDVDMLTLEYEAYNQTDVAAAWKLNCTYFQQMNALYKSGVLKGINDYKGWWTKVPMVTQTADTLVKYFSPKPNNLFLHDYRIKPDWPYMRNRCNDLNAKAKAQGKIMRIVVLFSFEPAFLQGWLKQGRTVDEAFWIVYNDFKLEKYSNLVMTGWMGFHLDYLRASQPTQAFMSIMGESAKTIFSQDNFKNKTTKKSIRLAKDPDQ